jgi:hypothetical protein
MSASKTPNNLWYYLCTRLWDDVRPYESDPVVGPLRIEDAERFEQITPPETPAEFQDLVLEWGRIQMRWSSGTLDNLHA